MSAQFASTPVAAAFAPDAGPGRHRIGLIALANDYATERDFINARPDDTVALFVTRVENSPDCTLDSLPRMAPHITRAAGLVIPRGWLDVIAYACTSGTVVMGYERICALIHAARPGIPVVTPITASLAALARFGARRIAVLTPYADDVNGAIAAHLEARGQSLCAFTSFGIEDNELMARLPPGAILQAAIEADRPEAEALFISCTAIRALDVAEAIEAAICKPVVTANQAMIWQSLRLSGCGAPVAGRGRLLRLAE